MTRDLHCIYVLDWDDKSLTFLRMMASIEAKLLQSIHSHSADILSCSFSGKLLATCSADKIVRLWSIDQSGESFSELPQSPLIGHSYAVNFCHFTPLGTLLATCSQDGRCFIWDTRTGRKVSQFEHASNASLRVCQFSPNARLLVTGGDDETLALWDTQTRRYMRSLEGHEASVVAASFSPDSSFLASGSMNGDLRIWDVRFGSGRHLALVPEAHDLGVLACQFSPSVGAQGASVEVGTGTMYLLATGGNDNLVKIWRVMTVCGSESGFTDTEVTVSLYTSLVGHSQNVMCLAFKPSGNYLASGAGDKSVIIWDPIKGQKLLCIDHHQRYVTCCAFSSDGLLLATGSNDKTVAILRIGDSEELKHEQPLIDLATSNSEQSRAESKPVCSWSIDDVGSWLISIQMATYQDLFKQNQIDGKELLHLNDPALKSGLGIDPLGPRSRILRAIRQLRDSNCSSSLCGVPMKRDLNYPDEFFCPITHEILSDPVISSDGYTYERSAIAAWIASGKRNSPMTNAPLTHFDLIPNRTLKMLVQKSTQL